MIFKELLYAAQAGNQNAKEEMFLLYRPLMINLSMINGKFDEDLYQELSKTFLTCIALFDISKVEK